MTNKEWIDLFSEKFCVSRTVAKEMLHTCMQIKRYDNMMKGIRNNDKKENL